MRFSAGIRGSNLAVEYLAIGSDGDLPDAKWVNAKVIVIAELRVSVERRNKISDWLVASGCMYMLAWGADCSEWDDDIDRANLRRFNYEIPDEFQVMTTWHSNETLDEVFHFAKHMATTTMTDVEIEHTVLLHLTNSRDRDRDGVLVRYDQS